MRIAFGLVGLLVTVAIMVWLFSIISIPTAKTGQKAQQQAEQISGRDENGMPVWSTFQVTPESRGGRLEDLLVTGVTPGGAMDKSYGLKTGDKIVAIGTQAGTQSVEEASNGDEKLAKIMVGEAYRDTMNLKPIVVIRNGQRITLPLSASATAPGGAQPAGGLQGQLNNINNSVPIPTH